MPTGASDPRLKTAKRAKLRATIARQRRPCEHPKCRLPGHPIDYTPGARGDTAYELDEILPRVHGGDPTDPTNVRPTHALCNRTAGAVITNQRRGLTPRPEPIEADEW